MRIRPRKLKYGFKKSAYLGFCVLIIFVMLGCTSTRKTTKTETTVTQSNDAVVPDAGQKSATTKSTSNDQPSSTTTTTTTSTAAETKPAGHPGILSSTVHAIGWVIALPFRLVGGLIGWIF